MINSSPIKGVQGVSFSLLPPHSHPLPLLPSFTPSPHLRFIISLSPFSLPILSPPPPFSLCSLSPSAPFLPPPFLLLLFVLCKLILQTRMRSHPMGLDVWILVGHFVYFHTSCMWTAKALARLRKCAGSPETLLVAYVISTIISWAGSNVINMSKMDTGIVPIEFYSCI